MQIQLVTFSVTALRGNLGKFAFNGETGSTFWVMAVIAAHKTHFQNLILPPKRNSMFLICRKAVKVRYYVGIVCIVRPPLNGWLKVEVKTW